MYIGNRRLRKIQFEKLENPAGYVINLIQKDEPKPQHFVDDYEERRKREEWHRQQELREE